MRISPHRVSGWSSLAADACEVTTRLAVILAAGLAAVLASTGYALSSRGSTDALKPSPHWGLYSPSAWTKLQSAAANHQLVPASVEIVTGTRLERNGQPFAIVRGRTPSGRQCFAVTVGTTVDRVICRVAAPVMTFTRKDTCAACAPNSTTPLKTLTVLALVRGDVRSVVSRYDGQARYVERVPAVGATSAFNLGAVRAGTAITALSSTNRHLSTVRLRTGT